MSNTNYIYLIRTREFINSNQHIYKVGRTSQKGFRRIDDYTNGSEVELIRKCINCVKTERAILKIFKKNYILYDGREWFEGDPERMIDDINAVIRKQTISVDDTKLPPIRMRSPHVMIKKVLENNETYRIKWTEVGHEHFGQIYTVTIKDLDTTNGKCSLKYRGVKKMHTNQPIWKFEIEGKVFIK
jgi:hypothetical protein